MCVYTLQAVANMPKLRDCEQFLEDCISKAARTRAAPRLLAMHAAVPNTSARLVFHSRANAIAIEAPVTSSSSDHDSRLGEYNAQPEVAATAADAAPHVQPPEAPPQPQQSEAPLLLQRLEAARAAAQEAAAEDLAAPPSAEEDSVQLLQQPAAERVAPLDVAADHASLPIAHSDMQQEHDIAVQASADSESQVQAAVQRYEQLLADQQTAASPLSSPTAAAEEALKLPQTRLRLAPLDIPDPDSPEDGRPQGSTSIHALPSASATPHKRQHQLGAAARNQAAIAAHAARLHQKDQLRGKPVRGFGSSAAGHAEPSPRRGWASPLPGKFGAWHGTAHKAADQAAAHEDGDGGTPVQRMAGSISRLPALASTNSTLQQAFSVAAALSQTATLQSPGPRAPLRRFGSVVPAAASPRTSLGDTQPAAAHPAPAVTIAQIMYQNSGGLPSAAAHNPAARLPALAQTALRRGASVAAPARSLDMAPTSSSSPLRRGSSVAAPASKLSSGAATPQSRPKTGSSAGVARTSSASAADMASWRERLAAISPRHSGEVTPSRRSPLGSTRQSLELSPQGSPSRMSPIRSLETDLPLHLGNASQRSSLSNAAKSLEPELSLHSILRHSIDLLGQPDAGDLTNNKRTPNK